MKIQFTQDTNLGDVVIRKGSVVEAAEVPADSRLVKIVLADGKAVTVDTELYKNQMVKVANDVVTAIAQDTITETLEWKDFLTHRFKYNPVKSPPHIGVSIGLLVGLLHAINKKRDTLGFLANVGVFAGIGLLAGIIVSEKNAYQLVKPTEAKANE